MCVCRVFLSLIPVLVTENQPAQVLGLKQVFRRVDRRLLDSCDKHRDEGDGERLWKRPFCRVLVIFFTDILQKNIGSRRIAEHRALAVLRFPRLYFLGVLAFDPVLPVHPPRTLMRCGGGLPGVEVSGW